MKDEKVRITKTQAIELLLEGETVHILRSGSSMLIGCDWSRDGVINAINKHSDTLEIGGDVCKSMGHALVLNDGELLFIESDKTKVEQLEKSLTPIKE